MSSQICLGEEDLKVTMCQAKLPSGRSSLSGAYDGDDTIYLMGGYGNWAYPRDVLKYTISTDKIEHAGDLPVNSYAGNTIIDKDKRIFHIVGDQLLNKDILQFSPANQSFVKVASLPYANEYSAVLQPDPDTVWIIGGNRQPKSFLKWNLKTFQIQKEANLSDPYQFPSAIFVEEKGAAYIFGDGNQPITKYNVSTKQFQKLPNHFPKTGAFDRAVWDGRYGYIIGGGGKRPSTDLLPGNTILRFDPNTEDVTSLNLEGSPLSAEDEFSDMAAVYVGKLNRIYVFGGFTTADGLELVDRDWIFYIDLGLPAIPTTTAKPTLHPEIYSCEGRPNYSMHPYPGDCKKFIICRHGHSYEFECPEDLLFNPAFVRCTFPEVAYCQN